MLTERHCLPGDLTNYESPLQEMDEGSLDEYVLNLVDGHEQIGSRFIGDFLFSENFKVTRQRVRDSVDRVDQSGLAERTAKFWKVHKRRVWTPAGIHGLW